VSYRPTRIGSLVVLEPREAVKQILQAYRDAGANMRDAAELIGVSERALHRYVIKLDLQSKLGTVRARAVREGWLNNARWPDKKKVES
jgi:hypothetical protein